MRRKSLVLAMIYTFLLVSGVTYGLDPTFLRNGEVYLSITGAPPLSGITDGVYRLNDPEGALKGQYPSILFKESLIQNFAVDITREIYTISDPVQKPIGAGYMLKRQVLDGTVGLAPSTYETGANQTSKFPTTGIVTERPTKFTHNITNNQADWGAHRYIHHDNRTTYGGAGTGTDIYRTNTTGQAKRDVKGCSAWGRNPWGTFKALQGTKTTAPDNPLDYLPVFTTQALVLPYYPEKSWYEIPNGAWFNSWRCKYGDGAGPNDTNGSPFPNRGLYYYQCYRDEVTGTQFDWRLVRHRANNSKMDNYVSYPDSPFATTYKTSIKRGVIAACLDGCGGSKATPTSTNASDMVFHPAFMPFSVGGVPSVTVYSYSRTEGTSNFTLKNQENHTRSYSFVTFGNGAGVGKNDTKWIGVSKGETEANGKERDYVYYLGTSQIQSWIPTIKNQNISAVSVSNQWNEKGGIIFAFDRTSNQIIKFTLNTSNVNTPGVLDNYTTINIATLLNKMGANSSIDDIAADGFGNLYVSLTYPSRNAGFNAPKALGYDFDDAISMSMLPVSPEDKEVIYNFRYLVDYRKSVWKISSVGQPLEEVGAANVAKVYFNKEVTVDRAKSSLMPTPSQIPSTSPINTLVKGLLKHESEYTSESNHNITGESKLTIINAPTPPEVLSLGDGKSYLDIIGAYVDYPRPDKLNFSTAQDSLPILKPDNLNLSTLYFFMVENYPIAEAIQDPKVSPDYDGDGKHSGFVSSIVNADPSAGSIKYYWNLWMVRDHRGKPVIPPNPSGDGKELGSEYTVFYSPIPAAYILTCKVQYDWYNYDTVEFGQTINDWKKKADHKKTAWAIPSSNVIGPSGAPEAADPETTLRGYLDVIFANYVASDTEDPSKKTAIDSIVSTIVTADSSAQHLAMEYIIATGTMAQDPIPEDEVARIQRCNPGGNVQTSTHWNPRTGMNPDTGYHGIDSQYDYYWRIDIASQSVFYNGVDKTNPTTGVTHSYITGTDYNFIADKLMNPTSVYYVNGKADFQFTRKTNEDLRWDRKLPELEAILEYPTLDKNGNQVTVSLPLTDVEIADGVEGGKKFKYIVLPAGLLPPTDPFVGTLRFKLTRMFEYAMYIFDEKGNLLMKNPIWLPKMLTIVGDTNVMVVDSQPPQVVYSETRPNQLYGCTGEQLTTAGNSQSATGISFSITDNNPWESLTTLSSHGHYDATNISYNEDRLKKIYSESSTYNLKPVFSNTNRYVRVYYDVANDDAQGIATGSYVPSWTGSASEDSINLKNTVLKEDDKSYNKLYTQLNLELPFSKFMKVGSNFSAITLPTNYANNTPSYQPLGFRIAARDSSGNELTTRNFNVVLHIKDTLLPLPFGEIKEYKNSRIAYVPAAQADMSSDKNRQENSSWYGNLKTLARTPRVAFDNNALWQADNTGYVGQFGGQMFYALPFINNNSNIVSLTSTPFNSYIMAQIGKLSPGNIELEDNVDVSIRAGATDNAGHARAKLTFKYYDINGSEATTNLDYQTTWTGNGVEHGSAAGTTHSSRIVFRESTPTLNPDGTTTEGPRFPLGIPIIIEAQDNAKEWDTYVGSSHTATSFSWGTLTPGADAFNVRTFKTTLPVYGTTFEIRTIDRYQNR